MWNLKSPNCDDALEHLKVLSMGQLGRELSPPELSVLRGGYEWYVATNGRPDVGRKETALGGPVDSAILGAYSQVQSTGALSQLRSALLLSATICPYCGFGEIGDLDHHLQKSHYKWLAVFPLNLVPACARCNRHKPRVPRADPTKHHIHAYLEDVGATRFLEATVDVSNGGLLVSFSVAQVPELSDEMRRRLSQHLVDFKLHERYKAQVNLYLTSQFVAVQSQYRAAGAPGVRAYLLECAGTELARHGLNDWRVALLEALSKCDEFCDGGFVAALGFAPA